MVIGTTVGFSPFRYNEERLAYIEEGKCFVEYNMHSRALEQGIRFANAMRSYIYFWGWIWSKKAIRDYEKGVFDTPLLS